MNPIAYPYLPEGKNIRYVAQDNSYIQIAKEYAKEYSTDRQHPTGSVVVREGLIIGKGANQVPLKNPKLKELHKNGWCVRRIFKIPSGQKYWLCPGCSKSSDHSEQQAVRDAIKNHGDIKGADLYLWGHWWCCEPCWNAIINAGIKDVFLMEGSERMFDKNHKEHVIGRQFDILHNK
jgi:deoxycytidylate deaminase